MRKQHSRKANRGRCGPRQEAAGDHGLRQRGVASAVQRKGPDKKLRATTNWHLATPTSRVGRGGNVSARHVRAVSIHTRPLKLTCLWIRIRTVGSRLAVPGELMHGVRAPLREFLSSTMKIQVFPPSPRTYGKVPKEEEGSVVFILRTIS